MNLENPRTHDEGRIIRMTDKDPDGFLDDDFLDYPVSDLDEDASPRLETKLEIDPSALVVGGIGLALGTVIWLKYFLP